GRADPRPAGQLLQRPPLGHADGPDPGPYEPAQVVVTVVRHGPETMPAAQTDGRAAGRERASPCSTRAARPSARDHPVRRTGMIRRPCAERARPEEPAWTAPLGAFLPARPRRAARLAGAAAASAGSGAPLVA